MNPMGKNDIRLTAAHNNAESWEICYREATTPWDRGTHPPGLEEWIEGRNPGRVLVPGCGRGHDARQLARAGFQVTAVDLSRVAIEEARAARGDLGIDFVCADLFALPSDWDGQFDYVWEHTCFCAIHPEHRPRYVEAMHRLLKPHGELAGLFFIQESGHVEGPPYKMPLAQLLDYLETHFTLQHKTTPKAHMEGREGQELLISFNVAAHHRA